VAKVLVGVFCVILLTRSWVLWVSLVVSLSEEDDEDDEEEELELDEDEVVFDLEVV